MAFLTSLSLRSRIAKRLCISANAVIPGDNRHQRRRFAEQFTVHPCTFGGDSVALGAALLPLEQLIAAPAPRGQRIVSDVLSSRSSTDS